METDVVKLGEEHLPLSGSSRFAIRYNGLGTAGSAGADGLRPTLLFGLKARPVPDACLDVNQEVLLPFCVDRQQSEGSTNFPELFRRTGI